MEVVGRFLVLCRNSFSFMFQDFDVSTVFGAQTVVKSSPWAGFEDLLSSLGLHPDYGCRVGRYPSGGRIFQGSVVRILIHSLITVPGCIPYYDSNRLGCTESKKRRCWFSGTCKSVNNIGD